MKPRAHAKKKLKAPIVIADEVQAKSFIEESLYYGAKRLNLDQLANDSSKEIVIKAYLKFITHYDGAKNLLLDGSDIEDLNARILPSEPTATPMAMAQIARAYAREHILEGTTQLQNNVYSADKTGALGQALKDIRNTRVDGHYILNVRTVTNKFERRMATCKKFSIGNCAELAYMALDFMLRNRPDMRAEICRIKGGNHMFLVVGRAKDSDPNNPETWGDEACICDPWSDAVYPAKEFMAKTKNYSSRIDIDGVRRNYVERFNPEKHKLELVSGYDNANFIRETSKLNIILVDIFIEMNKKHLAIYNELINELNQIAHKLTEKYGATDSRVQAVQAKIDTIRSEVSDIETNFHSYIQQIKDAAAANLYRAHKDVNDNLQQMMRENLAQLRSSRDLSADMSKKFDYRSLGEIIINFLAFWRKTELSPTQQYRKAMKEYEGAITDLGKQSVHGIDLQTKKLTKEELVSKFNKKLTAHPEGEITALAKELATELAKESGSEIIDLVKEIAPESNNAIRELANALVLELPDALARESENVASDFASMKIR